MSKPQNGFSLVELSIVIAIIGLLIGGVMAGRNIMRASSVNKAGIEITGYSDAIYRFQQQYGFLPGDMPDATSYWGEVSGTPATCRTTTTYDNQTCDGDGNGEIDDTTGSNEPFRAWQHLSAAEMVSGQYSGVGGSGGSTHAVPGENIPRGPMSSSGFYIVDMNALSGSATYWDTVGGTFILHGGAGAGLPTQQLFIPKEAQSIDSKFDDGLPQSGFLVSRKNQANCATSTSMSTANYNVSDGRPRCIIYLSTEVHWK